MRWHVVSHEQRPAFCDASATPAATHPRCPPTMRAQALAHSSAPGRCVTTISWRVSPQAPAPLRPWLACRAAHRIDTCVLTTRGPMLTRGCAIRGGAHGHKRWLAAWARAAKGLAGGQVGARHAHAIRGTARAPCVGEALRCPGVGLRFCYWRGSCMYKGGYLVKWQCGGLADLGACLCCLRSDEQRVPRVSACLAT